MLLENAVKRMLLLKSDGSVVDSVITLYPIPTDWDPFAVYSYSPSERAELEVQYGTWKDSKAASNTEGCTPSKSMSS